MAHANGQRIAVGTPALMAELGVTVNEAADARMDALKASGKTAVLVALDDRAIGVLGIADVPRDSAPQVIERLRRDGLKVVMLTGDDPRTAQAIGRAVGIDAIRPAAARRRRPHPPPAS